MRLLPLLFLILAVPPLRAGGDGVSVAGGGPIDALVREALARNAELQYYEALVAAAEGDRRQSAAWTNPELTVEGGFRRVEDLAGAELPDNGYTVGVSFTQTFEFPGKATLRQALAAQDVRLARLALTQFKLTLTGRVRQLARRYQAASSYAALTHDISARSGSLVELLAKRPLSGAKTLLDTRVIQASRLELAQAATDAAVDQAEALAELNVLLGRPAEAALNLPPAVSPPPLAIYELGDLARLAAVHNLQLQIREAEIEKAQLAVDASRLAKMPDFAIGPFFTQDVAGERETNVGLSVTTGLPLWDRNEGATAGAQARARAAGFLRLQAQREVEREVARRWRTYRATRELLAGFGGQSLGDLSSAAELADRQYRQGAIPVQLYLESQRALLNAQQIYHRAVLGLWDAQLDLELLTGGRLPATPKPSTPGE